MRLFVALPVPAAVERAIDGLQRRLTERHPELPVRWQAPERSHLTLVFLGDVAEPDLAYCRSALAAAANRLPTFALETAEPGAFPGSARPSVLWLGVTDADGSERLSSLQADLAERLSVVRRGQAPQAFRPHLTLGRMRRPPADPGALMAALAEAAPPAMRWRVEEVVLYRSHLARKGAVHTPLARASFDGDAPNDNG